MKDIPYASAVGSIMYAQVCTRLDIAFITGMLGRYLSNSGTEHWKVAKRVLRYLKRTRDYMLTYRRSEQRQKRLLRTRTRIDNVAKHKNKGKRG